MWAPPRFQPGCRWQLQADAAALFRLGSNEAGYPGRNRVEALGGMAMNHDVSVPYPTRRLILKIGSLAAGSLLLPLRGSAQTNATATKIGIIGSGKIGSTVGGLWVKA